MAFGPALPLALGGLGLRRRAPRAPLRPDDAAGRTAPSTSRPAPSRPASSSRACERSPAEPPATLPALAWVAAVAAAAGVGGARHRPWRAALRRGARRRSSSSPCSSSFAAGKALQACALGGARRAAGRATPASPRWLRTAVLAALVLGLALAARRGPGPSSVWLVYPLVALGGVKLLLQDVREGRPATLVLSLALYGAVLVLAPAAAEARGPGGLTAACAAVDSAPVRRARHVLSRRSRVALAAAATTASPAPQAVAVPRAAVVFSGPAMGARYARPGRDGPRGRGGERAGPRRDRRRARPRRPALLELGPRLRGLAAERARLRRAVRGVAPSSLEALELGRRASELTGRGLRRHRGAARRGLGLRPGGRAGRPRRRGARGPPRARRLPPAAARRGERHGGQGPPRRGLRPLGARRRLGGRPHRRAPSSRSATADVLVDVGGDVAARGRRPDGSRWRVAVEAPSPGRVGAIVERGRCRGRRLGDDRESWTDAKGRTTSHILDPRTAEPIAHDLASVTVVHRDGGLGRRARDGRCSCSGPQPGRALAARERLAARASSCGRRTGATPSGRRRPSTPWSVPAR